MCIAERGDVIKFKDSLQFSRVSLTSSGEYEARKIFRKYATGNSKCYVHVGEIILLEYKYSLIF